MTVYKNTVTDHIKAFLKWVYKSKKTKTFYTSDIQNLSERSKLVFGHRLGSSDTYNRAFRKLKEEGWVTVTKEKRPNKREAVWNIKGIK